MFGSRGWMPVMAAKAQKTDPPERYSVKNEHSARKHPLKQLVPEQCGSPPLWLACKPKT